MLKFQNQQLIRKLEAKKIEIINLKEKIGKLTEKQLPYENVVAVVNNSWEEVSIDHMYMILVFQYYGFYFWLLDDRCNCYPDPFFFFSSLSQTIEDLESHATHANDLVRCGRGGKDLYVRDSADTLSYNGIFAILLFRCLIIVSNTVPNISFQCLAFCIL